MKINSKTLIIHAAVIILSITFLLIGRQIAGGTQDADSEPYGLYFYSATITEILERTEEVHFGFTDIVIHFEARITSGPRRGEVIFGEQHQSDFFVVVRRGINVGDRVVLVHDYFGGRYFFDDFVRINYIAILGGVFLALVLVFGRLKGLNAIIALGLTCMAIFFVFVPAITAGRNIYVWALVVCLYVITSTLLLVIGANKKALTAMLGCLAGVAVAGGLMLIMDRLLLLTGMVDHEAQALFVLETPIDLRALVFAGVILGAVGAIMDVAMSIASSLWEVREAGGVSDFGSILKSGITIGKDILGTMLNTLILAYIGSSLTLILVINIHTTSYMELLNMELLIVEFLRALVGSFGMLAAIPFTALVCGWLYTRRQKCDDVDDDAASFSAEYSRSNRTRYY